MRKNKRIVENSGLESRVDANVLHSQLYALVHDGVMGNEVSHIVYACKVMFKKQLKKALIEAGGPTLTDAEIEEIFDSDEDVMDQEMLAYSSIEMALAEQWDAMINKYIEVKFKIDNVNTMY